MSLKALTAATEAKNEQAIIDILKKLAQGNNTDIELENATLPKSIIAFKNENITKLFVEISAEWCKSEHNRKIYTDKEIIDFLFTQLEQVDENLIVSSIRALGNICYENEDARKIVDKKGLATVISMLEADCNRKNPSLTLKTAGFLVNLLNSNEELQKAAIKLNIIPICEKILNRYIKQYKENEMLFAFLLNVLNNVIDYIDDQNTQFSESLCHVIIDIFKIGEAPEVCVSCLEILHGQSDKG